MNRAQELLSGTGECKKISEVLENETFFFCKICGPHVIPLSAGNFYTQFPKSLLFPYMWRNRYHRLTKGPPVLYIPQFNINLHSSSFSYVNDTIWQEVAFFIQTDKLNNKKGI